MPAAEIAIHSNLKVAFSSPWGFPLREDIAFTDAQGGDGGSLARRSKSVLQQLQKPLGKILEPDEAVLYFTHGQLMPGVPPGKWAFTLSAFILTASLLADIWLSIRMAQKAVRNFIRFHKENF